MSHGDAVLQGRLRCWCSKNEINEENRLSRAGLLEIWRRDIDIVITQKVTNNCIRISRTVDERLRRGLVALASEDGGH